MIGPLGPAPCDEMASGPLSPRSRRSYSVIIFTTLILGLVILFWSSASTRCFNEKFCMNVSSKSTTLYQPYTNHRLGYTSDVNIVIIHNMTYYDVFILITY